MYSQIVELLDPFLLGMVLLGVTILNLWRMHYKDPRGLKVVSGLYVILFITFTPLAAYFVRGTLEWRYPPAATSAENVDAIVVLMGDSRPPDGYRIELELGPKSDRRCILAAELYHASSPRVVFVSGGKVDPNESGPTLASAGGTLLHRLGVAKEHLVLEESSRTTAENAELTTLLLREREIRKIALVTDATHLTRAAACFHHCDEELEITPYGADYRATRFPGRISAFLPRASAASTIGDVLHEWMGIAWYRLSGKI